MANELTLNGQPVKLPATDVTEPEFRAALAVLLDGLQQGPVKYHELRAAFKVLVVSIGSKQPSVPPQPEPPAPDPLPEPDTLPQPYDPDNSEGKSMASFDSPLYQHHREQLNAMFEDYCRQESGAPAVTVWKMTLEPWGVTVEYSAYLPGEEEAQRRRTMIVTGEAEGL